MTNPMDALNGLQAALDAGIVQLRSCELHPSLQVLLDHPNGTPRFTYVQIDAGKVQAIALFALVEPVDGLPCFQMGYAVIEALRARGMGARILQQAMDELKHGLGRTPMNEFYLEAIVGNENEASNRLARRLISDSPTACDDCFSKEPAFQYLRKVQSGA